MIYIYDLYICVCVCVLYEIYIYIYTVYFIMLAKLICDDTSDDLGLPSSFTAFFPPIPSLSRPTMAWIRLGRSTSFHQLVNSGNDPQRAGKCQGPTHRCRDRRGAKVRIRAAVPNWSGQFSLTRKAVEARAVALRRLNKNNSLTWLSWLATGRYENICHLQYYMPCIVLVWYNKLAKENCGDTRLQMDVLMVDFSQEATVGICISFKRLSVKTLVALVTSKQLAHGCLFHIPLNMVYNSISYIV